MKNTTGNGIMGLGIAMVLLWLTIGVAVLVGWVMNIIDLIHMATVLTGMGAARIAGIFIPPLGAILGFFF